MSSLVAPAVPGGTPIGAVGNIFDLNVFGIDNVGVISLAQPINIEINNIRVRLISSFFIFSPTNINEFLFQKILLITIRQIVKSQNIFLLPNNSSFCDLTAHSGQSCNTSLVRSKNKQWNFPIKRYLSDHK